MKEKLIKKFKTLYGDKEDIRLFFAPGRVNLIGEHTDYNGGFVFPCALSIGTYAVVRKREDCKLQFFSENFQQLGVIESSFEDLKYRQEAAWTNYPKGVLWAFLEKEYKIDSGLDILFWGNIPNGSGLSSSASMEILTAFILKELFQLNVSFIEIARIGQYAENHFNGVNCGIMDQFACALGKKENGIFLNTSNLSYKYIPVKLEKAKILIASSNKKRGLETSKYNERRWECEQALKEIQKVKEVESLCDLSEEEFECIKSIIKNPIHQKRARHAVYENQRTFQAVMALKNQELNKFGRIMKESHISLRDDYEVTGKELDTLAESAWNLDGVIGARMTGAGFGGCTVNIVEKEAVDLFIKKVGNEYQDIVGYRADFYTVDIGGGPCELL